MLQVKKREGGSGGFPPSKKKKNENMRIKHIIEKNKKQ